MKTQIILRTVFFAAALLVSVNNNASKMQTVKQTSLVAAISHPESKTPQTGLEKSLSEFALGFELSMDHTYPEADSDHKVHSFHFTCNRRSRRYSKHQAGRFIAILYYVIILITYLYLPFQLFS